MGLKQPKRLLAQKVSLTENGQQGLPIAQDNIHTAYCAQDNIRTASCAQDNICTASCAQDNIRTAY